MSKQNSIETFCRTFNRYLFLQSSILASETLRRPRDTNETRIVCQSPVLWTDRKHRVREPASSLEKPVHHQILPCQTRCKPYPGERDVTSQKRAVCPLTSETLRANFYFVTGKIIRVESSTSSSKLRDQLPVHPVLARPVDASLT